jgi:RNA polymerase sigma-70 factor (ECF subfamily)
MQDAPRPSPAELPAECARGASTSPRASLPPQLFLTRITGCQSSLFAYICNLLGNIEHARDVLQETNVALWEKAEEYDPSLPFLPWALRFAYNQVLSFRSRQQRDRLVFDEEMLALVNNKACEITERLDDRLIALDECMQKLPKRQRTLLRERYVEGRRVNEISKRTGRSVTALNVTLFRIRKAIFECVMKRLAAEKSS